MKLLKLFNFIGISGGMSSFDMQFRFSVADKYAFDVDFVTDNDEDYEWRIEIVDFSGQYARTPVSIRFPTALKVKMDSDQLYRLKKKYDYDIPKTFFSKNPWLFPLQSDFEDELETMQIKRFFVKNIFQL